MPPSQGVGRRRFLHLVGAATAAGLLVVLALLPVAARAQEEAEARLQLVRQPPWHEPGDPLGIRLRITNTGDTELKGYEVRLRRFSAIEGRIQLHRSFDGVEELESFSRLGPRIPTLAPGESTDVTLRDRVESLGLAGDGVYPITLSLVDEELTAELDPLTTPVVHYAERPEDPLNLVPVMTLADRALKAPSGEYETTDEGRSVVAEILDPDTGWLTGMIAAMREAVDDDSARDGGLAAAVAPSARLIEELADAATSFDSEDENPGIIRSQAREALDDISDLLTSGSIQPLVSPYAFVDLPTLTSSFDQETLNRQLSEANVVFDETLPEVGFDPGWFFAPGLRWDEQSLANVRIAGANNADHTFFTRHAISGSTDIGCPDANEFAFAFACPVEIVTEARPVTGFVADPGIQERLVEMMRPGGDRVDLQRLFAETAMIHLEQPGTTERVVQMSVPSLLHPRPYLSHKLFSGLTSAPWLRLLQPEEALSAGPKPEKRDLTVQAPELVSQPDEDYFDAIAAARAAVSRYEEIGPPAERLQRLQRNILVSQSRLWWSSGLLSTGRDFAIQTEKEAEAELDKITVEGLDTTLTSQAAPVELTVFNENPYPVTVDIELTSRDNAITVSDEDLERLQDLTIGAEDNEQITVNAEAESSGIFSLSAVIKTPQNGFGINEKTITIRSTNFNRIAVGLTFGALAFLVLFSAWRWFRRNTGGAAPSEQAPA